MAQRFSPKEMPEESPEKEDHGFSGKLGIGFVEAMSAPLKGAAQLAGFKVDAPAVNNSAAETKAEAAGYFIGSNVGNAVLYIGSNALAKKIPGVRKLGVVAVGAGLGFLNPTAEGEGLETRAANAIIGAGTNAILKGGKGVFGKPNVVGESFGSSLKSNVLSSGTAGFFNTQAASLRDTGHLANFQDSVNGTLTWAVTGAAFHTAGASLRGFKAKGSVEGTTGQNDAGQLNLQPAAKWSRTPEADLVMAEQFVTDMKAGVALQKQVGPWIAVLGSSAPKPGSSTYKSAFEIGSLITSKLKMPVATGNGPGVMAGANEGAIKQGGTSVGIYLEGLPSEQMQNPFTTHNIRCKTLLARQHLLLSGADGAVIAPEGGAGTVFELTHMLIEMRRKVYNPAAPIVFVDDNTMWGGLRSWFSKNVVGRGLMSQKELDQTYIAHSPAEAIGILQQHLPKTRSNLLPFVSPGQTQAAGFSM